MKFNREYHVQYFLRNLQLFPEPYSSQDNHRIVLAFFCIHGLAILGELDQLDKENIIEWVYSMQVEPDKDNPLLSTSICGFRGGTALGNLFNCNQRKVFLDTSNIASTYAALCILHTLGDDLSRVNKSAIIRSISSLQNKASGCFASIPFGSEEDMRFVFCACAISYLLDDWSGISIPTMVEFITKSISYDGSIGIAPGTEGHGGGVYCAVASLILSEQLDQINSSISDLLRWIVFRQQNSSGGFHGRCNRSPSDSCYAFWHGGALDLLGHLDFVDIMRSREFILSCQSTFGGFCKYPQTVPDVMHSYYSLAWLSISANHTNQNSLYIPDLELPPLVPFDTKLQIPKLYTEEDLMLIAEMKSNTSTDDNMEDTNANT